MQFYLKKNINFIILNVIFFEINKKICQIKFNFVKDFYLKLKYFKQNNSIENKIFLLNKFNFR